MKKYFILLFFAAFSLVSHGQDSQDTEYKMRSQFFESERSIQFHLPTGFQKGEKLPLIFVFDAQWTPYYQLLCATTDYLIEIRELPRSILVGINAEDRQFELTPEPVNEDWKMPSLGGADELESHLLQEVIPFIDSLYPSLPFRTAVGHSLGGTFALNSLLDRPQLFNAVIAISPNLQIDEEEIVLKAARKLEALKGSSKFLFASVGNEGEPDATFLGPLERLDSVMGLQVSGSFDWHFQIHPGFNHATSPLSGIHQGLLAFGRKWRLSAAQKKAILSSGNVLEGFNGFFAQLSAWAGYPVSPSKNDFYDFIGFLETEEAYEDAIAVNEAGIAQFPGESRFYNGTAENLLRLGNKKSAKVYLEKALEILENEAFEYEGDREYFRKLYRRNMEGL